jgi:hypothetical protein
MNEHRPCSRTAEICELACTIIVFRSAQNPRTHIVNSACDRFAFRRMRAQRRKEKTTEGNSAQNTTGLRRDKSACHAGRQVADATRLSSGKSVGRWQVSANSREITRVRIAHYVLTSAARLAEANR